MEHRFYVNLAGRVDVFKILEGQRLFINQLAPRLFWRPLPPARPASYRDDRDSRTDPSSRDRPDGFQPHAAHPSRRDCRPDAARAPPAARPGGEAPDGNRATKEARNAAGHRVPVLCRADEAFATRLANTLLKQGIDGPQDCLDGLFCEWPQRLNGTEPRYCAFPDKSRRSTSRGLIIGSCHRRRPDLEVQLPRLLGLGWNRATELLQRLDEALDGFFGVLGACS